MTNKHSGYGYYPGSQRKTPFVFPGKRDATTSGFFQQLVLLQSTQQVTTGMAVFLSPHQTFKTLTILKIDINIHF